MNGNDLNDVVALTRALVAIPGINPELTDDPALSGEHRMAAFLHDYLGARGFRVSRHEVTPGRPNIVGRYGPEKPQRVLMIEAHLDTQGVHGMTVPPFGGEIRDGRIYGRGACDMKGPMAAALVNMNPAQLDALAAVGIQVIFVGAIGEETGNIGALEIAAEGIGADELLVLEPTDLHAVHAHKGVFWFQVEVHGRAAHGSNPGQGLNAICGMSRMIDRILDQTAVAMPPDRLLGPPTANIGMITGGHSTNIVPDRCVIRVDRRLLPGETGDAVMEVVRKAGAALVAEGGALAVDVTPIKEGRPFFTPADASLVRRLLSCCEECGEAPVSEGAGWYSDAGPLSRTCKEVVVFGPGSIRQAHTVDEYIAIDSLRKGEQILARFLARMATEAKH